MSEYLVLIYVDEKLSAQMTDAERAELLEQHGAFQQKHGAAVKGGEALQPSATARTVHVGDGRVGVTDGPYVETKEALGGFYLIDAPDLDAAVAVAADVPAPNGGVEVRPVLVLG
jgi:hypothetical protein